jgi:non-specific serine/threonine protein kinase/serine/threonine-protein kinase
LDAYAGRRLGPYEVIRRIGSGGTATVYEAFRRDGHFEQRVAIKLVRADMDRDFILRRLHTERQILAGMSHPGIARLLDGGATPEGTPYLVMEYIDGVPITDHCERENLTVSARLSLFEQVCAAVQHAHRNLVVHRDIKPGNVLVTAEGVVKLLDFGIAKLLAEGAEMHETAASTRMLTVEYASPEQVLGERVTTSSDVYSLGVLLYEMLCGKRPYEARTDSALEMAKLVCETSPRKPSTVVGAKAGRALAGDLDNIVLKAMRKEPERRYVSVEQLAGDVRRYLEGRPVLARQDTLAYRTAKFLRRNLAASVAAGLLLLAIAGGAVATAWQARVATRERARAVRRFNDVRELARNTLFEIDGAMSKVPGSTAARAVLCDRAVKLLDGLSKDSSGDYDLQLELSEAYRRLARVQGSVLEANLGDRSGAAESARKSLALAEAALAARPNDRKARRAVGRSVFSLTTAHPGGKEQDQLIDRMVRIGEAMVKEDGSDIEAANDLVASYQMRGSRLALDNPQAALADQERSLELGQRLVDGGHTDRRSLTALSFAHKKVGAMFIKLDRLPEAAAQYGAALELDERVLAMDPKNPAARFDITFTLSDTGFIYARQHEYKRALDLYQRVLEIREALARDDPRNMRARHGVASTCIYLGRIYHEQGDWKSAARYRERAIESIEVELRAAPDDVEVMTQRGWLYADLGQDYRKRGMAAEAAARFRAASEAADELKKRGADSGDLRKAADAGLKIAP